MCLDLSTLLLLLLLLITTSSSSSSLLLTAGGCQRGEGVVGVGFLRGAGRGCHAHPLHLPWDGGGDEDRHVGGGRVGSGVVGVVGGGRGEGGAGPGRGGHGGDGGHRGTDGHAAAGVPGVGHQRAAGGHVVVAGAPAGTTGTAVQTGTLSLVLATVSFRRMPDNVHF